MQSNSHKKPSSGSLTWPPNKPKGNLIPDCRNSNPQCYHYSMARWGWGSLAMGSKAKRLLSFNHTTKIIHQTVLIWSQFLMSLRWLSYWKSIFIKMNSNVADPSESLLWAKWFPNCKIFYYTPRNKQYYVCNNFLNMQIVLLLVLPLKLLRIASGTRPRKNQPNE